MLIPDRNRSRSNLLIHEPKTHTHPLDLSLPTHSPLIAFFILSSIPHTLIYTYITIQNTNSIDL